MGSPSSLPRVALQQTRLHCRKDRCYPRGFQTGSILYTSVLIIPQIQLKYTDWYASFMVDQENVASAVGLSESTRENTTRCSC